MRSRTGHVVLFGGRRPLDAFAGVPEILRDHGVEVLYERLWDREMRFGHHAIAEVMRGARAIALADLSYNAHLAPTKLARAMRIPTVLLVDGVVEYANTHRNPWLGPGHLQETPHDIVLAMGPLHGRLLTELGNTVAVTGLPRLDGFEERIAEARTRVDAHQWLLVATANTPAMDGQSLARVHGMLAELRDEAIARGLGVRWRIDASLAHALGVPPDTAPLTDTLARAAATITTASTLAVESMLAGVPTAVAHPHPWPLWVPAAWVWSAALDEPTIAGLPIERFDACGPLLEAILDAPDLGRQRAILDQLHAPNAAVRVAQEVLGARWTNNTNPLPSMGRVRLTPSPCDTLHVALCDHVQPRPPMVERARRAMATDPRAHLLCIGLGPLNFEHTNTPALDHPRAHEIVLDPIAPEHERGQSVLDAALALDPQRVIIDDDRALPLAAQLVSRGVACDDERLRIRNDHAVRTIEVWPFGPRSPADALAADAWLERELRHAGYRRIAHDQPDDRCDAVLVRASSPRPHPALVEHWRDRGFGVAVSPNMHVQAGVYAAERAIARLLGQGCARIAVAHHPERSPVLAAPIRHGAAIVGWLDDIVAVPTTHMGLPAYTFDAGIERLRPDGILALHESDLPRCRATGLPTELVDLHEALTHQPDHRLREPVHREPLAHPRVDGR